MSEKQEIRNCKCGNKSWLIHDESGFRVSCPKHMGGCGAHTLDYQTEQEAIVIWDKTMDNRRSSEAPVQSQKNNKSFRKDTTSFSDETVFTIERGRSEGDLLEILLWTPTCSDKFSVLALKQPALLTGFTQGASKTKKQVFALLNACPDWMNPKEDDDPKRSLAAMDAVRSQKNVKGVGKVNMNLLLVDMAEAVREVCEVMTHGAVKHEPTGWKKVPNGVFEYTNSLHRHLNQEACGEVRDPEWDKHHAAHAACSALIRLQLIIDAEKKEAGK